jgi:ParB family chromosome partitioning protein
MAKHKFENGLNPLDEIKERINKKEIKGNMVIDIERIIVEEQPRTTFKDIEELSQSIQQFGILVPLLVESLNNGGYYRLIAGERRYRAAKEIGLKEIPVICDIVCDQRDILLVQIIENLQRADLSPLELARSFQKIKEDWDYSSDEIAKKVGKSKRYVNEILKILDLPVVDIEKIDAGEAYTNFTRKKQESENTLSEYAGSSQGISQSAENDNISDEKFEKSKERDRRYDKTAKENNFLQAEQKNKSSKSGNSVPTNKIINEEDEDQKSILDFSCVERTENEEQEENTENSSEEIDNAESAEENDDDDIDTNFKAELSNPCSCRGDKMSCERATADGNKGNIISKVKEFNLSHENIKINLIFNAESEFFHNGTKAEVFFDDCYTADTFINVLKNLENIN